MGELAVFQLKLSIPDKKKKIIKILKSGKHFLFWVFLIQHDAFKAFTWVNDLFGWYFHFII